MSTAGKKRKTRAEKEGEELAECGRKATELLLASMKAVREMYGLHSSQQPDMQCVQAHVRATCQFMSDKRQKGLEATIDRVDLTLNDIDTDIHSNMDRLCNILLEQGEQ
tara:strand:- start:39 stop:365 length:327 start_codon:yes stop_codon:yes gene_type:complete